MQPTWIAPRDLDFSLKDFARGVLEIAKENLTNDGELHACAFVLTGESIHCCEISFSDHDEKEIEYKKLVEYARENSAIAIVSLNDAYVGTPDDIASYYPGKLQHLKRKECIHVCLAGPELENWSAEVPYDRSDNGIKFDAAQEFAGGEIGFLHDWASSARAN
jgi:hypothetical protein